MNLNVNSKNSVAKVLVMAASFCMIFVCLGFCSSNKSLYLSAITDALNIKRSVFSINDSCRFIATAVINLFFGALVQKFGAKKLIAAGFSCLIISMLIYAHATQVAVFYVGGCFLGIGIAWTTTTMASYLVNRWFVENRGTMSGIILCANGLGGALAAQIITPIIYEDGNPFGYRNAYRLVAVILLVVGIIVVISIREPSNTISANAVKKKIRGASWPGISQAEACTKPYFYAAAICVFLTGMGLQGINGIAAAHLRDAGINPNFVATLLSIHSVALCASKFMAGFSYDKLGLRMTLIICGLCGVFSFLALAFSGTNSFGIGCSIAWSVLSSFALPLETVMVPLIVADLFGEKDFSKLVGLFVSFNVAGYALGTPLANVIYDICKTYQPMLFVITIVMVVVIVSFPFIINASNKVRRQLLISETNS